MIELVLAFAGSFVAGYLGAAVGLVLGTLRLPLVVLLVGEPAAAAGTNIAISTAAAASGSYAHAREGRVAWRVVAWMGPPSVIGAVLGAALADVLPETLFLGMLSAVLAWNGVDLIARPIAPRPAAAPRTLVAAVFGLAIGVVGGALGVILGTLRMPALLRAVGLPAARAVGTNLVVGFLLGLFGFLAHAADLDVEWGILGAGVIGAVTGAALGSRLTGRVSEPLLRAAIGIALIAVAAAFAVEVAVAVV